MPKVLPMKVKSPADPKTAGEWQDAVNTAAFLLLLDSARKYGLIKGGPVADLERCDWILRKSAALGYLPETE